MGHIHINNRHYHRFMGAHYIMSVLFIAMITACQPNAPQQTPTPTPQVIVKRLATLAPTDTPGPTQNASSAQALPTKTLPILTMTPTPYIGIFLGEAEIGEINAPFSLPTREITPTSPSPLAYFNCAMDVGDVFGLNWVAEPRALNGLHCPIQEWFGFVGRVQVFENGAIYWRTETGEFWLIEPGTLIEDGQFWKVDQPTEIPLPNLPLITAGLLIPEGPMKDAWLSITDARAKLGYGLTPELEVQVNLQRFEGGTLFADLTAGQVFALLVNGDVIGPIATN